jgi:2-polyprenyl-3-methyl-5-hydroxy-6-metoxy-1,4-benzoquinol methylase
MNCPVCNGDRFWKIAAARDNAFESRRAFDGNGTSREWRLCQRCGNAYPSHPPDLRKLQELWALNRADADSTPPVQASNWRYRRTIAKTGATRSYRLFSPLASKAKGRFIDIACGLGETVSAFAAHGWDAEGIDADPSTEPVHREIGIRSRIGQFEEVEIGKGYDIIHIAHAIYFITDPMRFIRLVRERLAPAGLFCIVLADFLANSDRGLPNYTHTFYPTARSIRYALALAGFETVFCKRRSGSIYIAAHPAQRPTIPFIWPVGILVLYRTKSLRYHLLGRPFLALRRAVKFIIRRH